MQPGPCLTGHQSAKTCADMRIHFTALLAGTALLFPAIARADDAGGEIVVSGHGLQDTPAIPVYDVQKIDRDRLLSSASGRIEDVLSSVAGFQQCRRSDSRASNPSAQGVTLRALGGNASSRAAVLLDGVPMADPFFGYIPLSALAPERLSSARVTRGGGSGAFGSGAVAGTIELESAGPAELGLANGSLLIDDRGSTEASASISPQLGQGFAVVTARWDRGPGFWTTPAAQRNAASVKSRYESWSTGVRLVAPLAEDIELQVRGMAFRDERSLRFAGADTSSRGEDASVRLVGRGAWAFDALAYVQARDFTNIVISSTTFRKSLDQYKTPTTGLGAKLELRPPVGEDHVLRLGADWRQSSGNAQEAAYNATSGALTARRRAGGRNSDLGLFLEDDWTLGRLVLTAGGRADRWTIADGSFVQTSFAQTSSTVTVTNTTFAGRSGWQGTWRAGARINAGGGLALRGAAYTGLRLPTLNELYRPFSVFPVTTQANAALGNERLRGFEAGLDLALSEIVSFSITGFDDRVKGAIANVTIGTNQRQRRNVDAVHAKGLEFSASVRTGQLRFDGSLAWTDAKVEASGTSAALDGMRPAQTPRIAGSATVAWLPRENWTLALTLKHTGLQYEDDLMTDILPAATTLDAFVEVPVTPELSLVLRGENLWNETVVTRNQAGSMDLGTPRTVWAGLRLRLP